MEDSIYTKIIKGEIPCHTIYEDSNIIVILDIYPITAGHTLIISKQQIDHAWDLSDEHYQALFAAAKRIAPVLKDHFNTKRAVLKIEGYDIAHAHVHLLPANIHADTTAKQDLTAEPDHERLSQLASKLKEKIDNAK